MEEIEFRFVWSLCGHLQLEHRKPADSAGLRAIGGGHEIRTHMRSDNSPEFIAKEQVR